MGKLKKLLLINPINRQKGLSTIRFTRFQPMALGIIAGMTPSDVQVEVIDENFDEFEEKIKVTGLPDLAGITSFTPTVSRGYEIAAWLRDKKVPVVMGGIHVSFRPEEALNYCDSIVVGEAEGLWEKVLADFDAGSLAKIYRHEDEKEVTIGKFKSGIFDKKYFWGAVQTSRGCPMDCDFCTVTIFNGFKYRQRDPQEVIDELKKLKQKYILFYDDNIVGRSPEQKRASLELFKRIAAEKLGKIWMCQCSINVGEDQEILSWMYKAGCRLMCVGFESVDEGNLKKMHKGHNLQLLKRYPELIGNIHRNGIAILSSFMIGYPFDSGATTKILPEFINRSGIDAFQLTHLTPFPGTKLFKRLEAENLITALNYPEDWKKYNFSNVVYRHESLSAQELGAIVDSIKMQLIRPFFMLVKRFIATVINTGNTGSAILAFLWQSGVRTAFIKGLKKRAKAAEKAGA